MLSWLHLQISYGTMYVSSYSQGTNHIIEVCKPCSRQRLYHFSLFLVEYCLRWMIYIFSLAKIPRHNSEIAELCSKAPQSSRSSSGGKWVRLRRSFVLLSQNQCTLKYLLIKVQEKIVYKLLHVIALVLNIWYCISLQHFCFCIKSYLVDMSWAKAPWMLLHFHGSNAPASDSRDPSQWKELSGDW